MIPYDDLVAALTAWRARQGLPVAQPASLTSTAAATPAPMPTPTAAAPAYPSRGPATPPPRSGPVATPTPPPLAPADLEDVDSALIEEAQYDNEGDDFAMAFDKMQQVENDAEATSIGMGPPTSRDSFGGSTQPDPPSGKRRNDW
jgi:hypothetical protein